MVDFPWDSIAIGASLFGAVVQGRSPGGATRRPTTSKLTAYECFFGVGLLGIVGLLLGFELMNLNPSRESLATAEIERLGGHIEFGADAAQRATVAVDFADAKIADDDLVCLEQFSRIDRLCLARTPVTDEAFRHFSGLSAVHDLDLSDCRVGDAGLRTLVRLRGLQRLNLAGTRITDAAVADLASLTELQELNVENTGLSDAGRAELAQRIKLPTLRLGRAHATTESLTAVENVLQSSVAP